VLQNFMKLLFIGDVVGKPGRRAVISLVPGLRNELGIDVVIANGENLAGGSGVTEEVAREVFGAGVDVLTGGNHLFDKRESHPYIAGERRVVRPANYPPGTPGAVSSRVRVPGGDLWVACVLGRVFMRPLDDPFRAADRFVDEARSQGARYLVLDAHAEASSEKMALAWSLDGKVSLVVGTHTHVPTADERILPGGTGFVTDIGMTGPYDSVIGMEKEPVIAHFRTGLYHPFKPASRDVRLYAMEVTLDESTGKTTAIQRVVRRLPE
jgi:metallophosphoesterase (TIGR00282 family)